MVYKHHTIEYNLTNLKIFKLNFYSRFNTLKLLSIGNYGKHDFRVVP